MWYSVDNILGYFCKNVDNYVMSVDVYLCWGGNKKSDILPGLSQLGEYVAVFYSTITFFLSAYMFGSMGQTTMSFVSYAKLLFKIWIAYT